MWCYADTNQSILASGRSIQNKRLITFIFASIILLYFIFAPGVNGSYYAGDDFRYAFGGYSKHCIADDGFGFMLTLGRPIQAYLDCFNYKVAYTVERMSMIRFFAVAIMGCGMGLLAEIFCYFGFAFWTAFFAAGSLFLIPALYGDTISTAATSLPVSLICVLLAYYCLIKTYLKQRNKKIGFGLAALFIFISLLTYPALTFPFCSLILAKVLFSRLSDLPKTKQEVIREVVLFISVCTLYFIWAVYNMRYHALAPIPPQYHTDHPNLNISEMIARMGIVGNVFTSIWELLPAGDMRVQGCIMIVFMTSGIFAGLISFFKSPFYSQNKKIALVSLAQAILGVIALFVLSSAFFLIIPQRDMGSRLSLGITMSGLMLVFWSALQIASLLPAFLRSMTSCSLIGLLFLIQAYHTNIYLAGVTANFEKRLDFVKTAIIKYVAKDPQLHRIHFILEKPDYPYTRFFLANGALMQVFQPGGYTIQWCSLPREMPEDEPGHQKEALACINGLQKNGIAITYSYYNDPFVKTDHMMIINNKDHVI